MLGPQTALGYPGTTPKVIFPVWPQQKAMQFFHVNKKYNILL